MTFQIDGALYPDQDVPLSLNTLEEQIDFLARLCASWDFGLLPDAATLAEIRQLNWRAAVDVCQLLTSPTYHLLREWHQLPPVLYLGSIPAYIAQDPNLEFV